MMKGTIFIAILTMHEYMMLQTLAIDKSPVNCILYMFTKFIYKVYDILYLHTEKAHQPHPVMIKDD